MSMISGTFALPEHLRRQATIRSSTTTRTMTSTIRAMTTSTICTPALQLGLTLVMSPNSTSKILAGNNVTVNWKFSSNGDYEIRIPAYISIQWQFVGDKINRWDPTNNQVGWIAQRLPLSGQDSMIWNTDRQMRDGWYRLRILPDGKDFYATPPPCFQDLDVMPGMSASFFIGTSRVDGNGTYPDPFGPSSGGTKMLFSFVMLILALM